MFYGAKSWSPCRRKMMHVAPQKEKDVEKLFLLFMFFIAASYAYGPLLLFPLYQALAASKGEEEVDSTTAGIVLMCAKYLSIIVHNLFSRFSKTLRGLQLQVAGFLTAAAVSMAVAASPFVPGVGTLIGVATLFFTNSNVIAGPLWPVPSEKRSQIRMFVYYACCPAGSLWTSLAVTCLGREDFQSRWGLRTAVILLPVLVTLISWLMLPPDGFWGPERMWQRQMEKEAQLAEEQRQLEEKLKEQDKKVGEDDDFDGFGEAEDARSKASCDDIFDEENRKSGFRQSGRRNSAFGVEDKPQQSLWRNGRFRVLVATQSCTGTLHPPSDASPRLQNCCQVLFIDHHHAPQPSGHRVLGKMHWVFYLLCLLLVDVLLSVTNVLLAVVVLRALQWDQITDFHNIVGTLSGVLAGASFLQMPVKAMVGSWELASVIGHGVPFALLMLLYATHCKTMRELWILLLKPVRLTIEGGYEDLAEVEEDSHVKISRASSKPEVEEDLHVSSEPEVEEEAPAKVVIDRDLGILPGTIAD
eukprot:symbB.v1.2.027244.t1/scaffold2780.1/size77252/2